MIIFEQQKSPEQLPAIPGNILTRSCFMENSILYNSVSGSKLNQKFKTYSGSCNKVATSDLLANIQPGALGIYAFNSATILDQGKNVKQKIIKAPKIETRRNERRLSNRKKTWKLKEQSATLLNTMKEYTTKKDGNKTLSRVWHCGKTPVSTESNISYVRGITGNNYFTNLQHCASYWVCPVCAGKVARERTDEIYLALKEYLNQGYEIYFGALTLPHYQSEGLKENMEILIKGFDWVKEHRAVKNILPKKTEVGEDGKEKSILESLIYLRSLEITFGVNGWHPHLHPIFILPKGLGETYINQFRKYYLSWLEKKQKLTVHAERRAVNFELWDKKIETLSDYLCKWSISNEVGNGQSKKSKTASGFTPFQILELIAEKKTWDLKQDPETVFKQYARIIKGRRMLQSSRGFFEMVNVEVKTDEEIVKDDETAETLFTVSLMVWNEAVRKDLIFDLVDAYDFGGVDAVSDVIDYIYSLLEKDTS